MDLMNRANQSANNATDNGFKDGEYVEIMFLDTSFPKKELEKFAKEQEEKKKKAEIIGKKGFKEIEPSAKHLGINWRVCVLKRNLTINDKGEIIDGEKLINVNNGIIEFPNFQHIFYLNQPTPERVLKAESKKGFKYGSLIWGRGGSEMLDNEGNIKLAYIFPSTRPAQMYDKEKEKFITANNIPDDEEEHYENLLRREEERIEEWNKILEEWNKMKPEDCEKFLNQGISLRYLLKTYHDDDDELSVMYHLPQKGMRAFLRIDRPKKFANLAAFGKIEKDDGSKEEIIFNKWDIELPNDKSKKLADLIITQKDDLDLISEENDNEDENDVF